jgi:hypothetical protein
MPLNPDATTLAVSREYANYIRDIAKKEGMDMIDVTNQLLNSALQNGIELEVKVKKVKLKPLAINAK